MSKESIRNHLERHQGAESSALPRESLIRAMWPADFELRDAEEGGPPVMFGHFAVFDRWTEIDSLFEGQFMERLARGSFEKTFEERQASIRPLFQHGKDPQMGSQVLGRVDVLREDDTGAYYEVPLYDGIPPLILAGLRDGAYGASFRFRVMREEIVEKPNRSDYNPDGLPERTIKEVELHEFGPVTFPAYPDATAGVRSLTDEFLMETLVRDRNRLRNLISYIGEPSEDDADAAPEPVTSSDDGAGRGSVPATPRRVRKDYLKEEVPSWTL